jgi:peroxisomal enoyl-CoA hydratase 2
MPIEAGQVLQFRRALGLADVGVVPPTFAMVADHFDPDFGRRPRAGVPWLGSASGPSGVADGDPAHEGLFHVEHRFEHGAPLVPGETVTARRLAPRTWTKQGRRGGQLSFVETTSELVHDDGTLAVRSVWLDVATERSHAALTAAQVRSRESDVPSETPAGASSTVVVADLTRTQIVMYVCAAGDFHPLHHDDVYCRQRGLPGAFAPGMLTMGLTGRAVCDALEVDGPTGFGGRLHAQVWPGDTLTAHVVEADPGAHPTGHAAGRAVEVATTNQHGAVVFSGWATAGRRPSA